MYFPLFFSYVVPGITSGVTVISTYTSSAESAELNEVLVQWEHVVSKLGKGPLIYP